MKKRFNLELGETITFGDFFCHSDGIIVKDLISNKYYWKNANDLGNFEYDRDEELGTLIATYNYKDLLIIEQNPIEFPDDCGEQDYMVDTKEEALEEIAECYLR